MARDDDDDDASLSWDGDESDAVIERPTRAVVTTPDDEDDVAPATSSIQLVTYGILAGVYALYAVGWGITVVRSGLFSTNLFIEIMSQFSEFLAIIAAPLWFALAFMLTRNSRRIVRLVWLVAGLVVLMPVPFILGGA